MWHRSVVADHRALLIGIPPAHACLSFDLGAWVLTTRRGTRNGALWEVLQGWPMPVAADLDWVGGG